MKDNQQQFVYAGSPTDLHLNRLPSSADIYSACFISVNGIASASSIPPSRPAVLGYGLQERATIVWEVAVDPSDEGISGYPTRPNIWILESILHDMDIVDVVPGTTFLNLHIHPEVHIQNVTAKEVRICRVTNREYPEESLENLSLQRYFSIPRCVHLNKLLTVAYVESDAAGQMNGAEVGSDGSGSSSTMGRKSLQPYYHMASEIKLSWYIVTAVILPDGSELGCGYVCGGDGRGAVYKDDISSHQLFLCVSAVNLSTRLVLGGFHRTSTLPPLRHTERLGLRDLRQMTLTHCRFQPEGATSGEEYPYTPPDPLPTSPYLIFGPYRVDMDDVCTTGGFSEDGHDIILECPLSSALMVHLRLMLRRRQRERPQRERQFSSSLMRRPQHRQTHPSSSRGPSSASYSPLLVTHPVEQDIINALRTCADALGVLFQTVDCRTVAQFSSWSSHAISSSPVQSKLIADIISARPCLLYIRGLDAACAIGSTSAADAIDSQSTLCAALTALLNIIYNTTDDTSSFHDAADDQILPLVVCWCGDETAIRPHLKSIFPLCVETVRASTQQHSGQCDAKHALTKTFMAGIGSSLGGGMLLSGDVKAWVEEGSSFSTSPGVSSRHVCRSIAQESALSCLQRCRSDRWLRDVGIGVNHFQGELGAVRNTDPIVLSVDDITVANQRLLPGRDHATGGGGKGVTTVSAVHWSDIGGLHKQRQEILDVLSLPKQHPDLFTQSSGTRRRGVLLFGPPGTGKTLVARAVATECGMTFMSIKGPELLDVYVGESERNVRNTFQMARKSSPCVLFFDELDSLAPARGRGSDGGGVMDRVVSTLLSELDSLDEPSDSHATYPLSSQDQNQVFVIGATNRPDLLDPALLRPGRFDRLVYLGPSKDMESRSQTLSAQTRKFNLAIDVDLQEIARALPDPCTGADIGAVASSAFARALERTIQALHDNMLSGGDPEGRERQDDDFWGMSQYINTVKDDQALTVLVTQNDLLVSAQSQKPSVTSSELAHYEKLARTFADTS
eukprot:gene8962-18548_t